MEFALPYLERIVQTVKSKLKEKGRILYQWCVCVCVCVCVRACVHAMCELNALFYFNFSLPLSRSFLPRVHTMLSDSWLVWVMKWWISMDPEEATGGLGVMKDGHRCGKTVRFCETHTQVTSR